MSVRYPKEGASIPRVGGGGARGDPDPGHDRRYAVA